MALSPALAEEEDAAASAIGETVQRLHGVNIAFLNELGQEVEALVPVCVRIEGVSAGRNQVLHVGDDGIVSLLPHETGTDDSITFATDAFSTFVIVELVETHVITTEGETYRIQVSYDSHAGIPDGAVLSASEILAGSPLYEQYYAEIADQVETGVEVISSVKLFDISILDENGQEVQPAAPVKVSIALEETQDGAPQVLHMSDEPQKEPETVDTTAEAEGVTFTASGFSVYALVYTVDFEYEGCELSIPGGTYIWLSDLLSELGIPLHVTELSGVTFSDSSLLDVEFVTDEEEPSRFDWRLTSLQPFTSEETLTLTKPNGAVILLRVTDDQQSGARYSSDLSENLKNLHLYVGGEEVPLGEEFQVRDGMLYDLVLDFQESRDVQFADTGELYYQLPSGFTLPDNYQDSLTINLGLDGKMYNNPLIYDKANNRLVLRWNEQDRKYSKLIAAGNLRFNIHLQGYIEPGDLTFEPGYTYTSVRYDPHNAKVSKTGELDYSDIRHQKMK